MKEDKRHASSKSYSVGLDNMHIVTAYKNNGMKFSLIRKDSGQPLLLFCNEETYKHTFTL